MSENTPQIEKLATPLRKEQHMEQKESTIFTIQTQVDVVATSL